MIGSTLYLAMVDPADGQLVPDASPCNMCRRMIINAGIERVIIRNTRDKYTIHEVRQYVEQDDTLPENQLDTY